MAFPGQPFDDRRVGEFEALAAACDLDVLGASKARRARRGGHLLGSGTLERLVDAVRSSAGVEAVLVDTQLAPGAERSLQRALGVPIVDRTRLILEIFSRRARTAEAKQQVELARLRYESNRLVRGWTHLERQRGALSSRGGPGETQIELDRRGLRRRIQNLERRVQDNLRHRRHRASGADSMPTAAIVGYTSAGKTTLFNALVGERQFASDMLFATLDPRRRRIDLGPAGTALLSDTVGFIREVPLELVAAFEATLSEIRTADLLLLAVDVSDPQAAAREGEVLKTLEGMGAGDIPRLRVETKIDLRADPRCGQALPRGAAAREVLEGARGNAQVAPDTVEVAARQGRGLDRLRLAIAERLRGACGLYRLTLRPCHGRLRAQLHERGAVVGEEAAEDGRIELLVRLPEPALRRLVGRFADVRSTKLPSMSQIATLSAGGSVPSQA